MGGVVACIAGRLSHGSQLHSLVLELDSLLIANLDKTSGDAIGVLVC